MVEHKCRKCNRVFYHKSEYNKHRKILDCTKIKRTRRVIHHNCDICGKSFQRSDHLNLHVGPCLRRAEKKRIEREKIIASMKPNGKKSSNMNIKTVNGVANGVVNGTVNGVVNNNTKINIAIYDSSVFSLVAYTHNLDLFDMPVDEREKILKSKTSPYITYFELVHCNPERLQYHNIYYKNENRVYVYTKNGWAEKNANNVIEHILISEIKSITIQLPFIRRSFNDKEFGYVMKNLMSIQIPEYAKGNSKQMENAGKERKIIKERMMCSLREYDNVCGPTFRHTMKTHSSHVLDKFPQSTIDQIQKAESVLNYMVKRKKNNNDSSASSSNTDCDDLSCAEEIFDDDSSESSKSDSSDSDSEPCDKKHKKKKPIK